MDLESLYRAHFESIWRMVRHFGVAEKDALDVVQEVFLVAHHRLSEFEGRSTVKTWLHGIAFRVSLDRQRKASERRELLDNDLARQSQSPQDLQAELEQRELARVLERILAALPFEQRAVFTLHEFEGLTAAEIAEALAIPPGTAASRLRLARQAFSRAVRELADDHAVNKVSGGAR